MHGTNPVRERETDPLSLQVHEIFLTVQGEGPFSGQRAIFIRMSGCNLRCWWCDTVWDDDKDPYMSPSQIFDRVQELGEKKDVNLIVITGGEPCRQNLGKLVLALSNFGYQVQIETAGSIWQDCLLRTTIVISPKTPVVHSKFYLHAAHWKYPLMVGHVDPKDGLPCTNTQKIGGPQNRLARPPRNARIYVTPVDMGDGATDLANRQLVAETAIEHGYIAQLQIHKYLMVP